MSRNLIILLIAGAIAVGWALLDGPAARQRRGAAQAQAFDSAVQPRLNADPRFASVQVSRTTHPALRVTGEVPDDDALRDLTELMTPPTGASFRVFINVKVIGRPADPDPEMTE